MKQVIDNIDRNNLCAQRRLNQIEKELLSVKNTEKLLIEWRNLIKNTYGYTFRSKILH